MEDETGCPYKRPQLSDQEAALVKNQTVSLLEEYDQEECFETVLQKMAWAIRKFMEVHQAAVSHIDKLDFAGGIHAISLSDKYARYRTYNKVPTGCGIWRLPLEEKTSMRLTHEELQSHPAFKNFSHLKDSRGLEHPPLRGWLAIPILDKDGEATGLLQVSDKQSGGEFTDLDEAKLSNFSSLVSVLFQTYKKNLEVIQAEQIAKDLASLNEHLKETKAEVEHLNHILSHDFLGFIGKIVEASAMIAESKLDSLGKTERRLLEIIGKSATQMRYIMKGIVRFSRTELKQLEKTEVNMNEIVHEIIEVLVPLAREEAISIQVSDLGSVEADEEMVRLVWTNLIGNAIKYSAKIEHPVIEIGRSVEGNEVIYHVKDNGAGFNQEEVNQLFEPYKRLHDESHFPGSGLGLSNAFQIVKKHGGRMWGESAGKNQGATIYFSLPC